MRSVSHILYGQGVDSAPTPTSRVVPRVDVNKEDWKAVNDWIAAVVSGLPLLGLKTIEQLGGGEDR